VRPETIRRWKTGTSRNSGPVTSTEAAMIRPQGSAKADAPVIGAIATGAVRL
jgi:hypothetical protein